MTEIMPVPRNSHITVLRPPSILRSFLSARTSAPVPPLPSAAKADDKEDRRQDRTGQADEGDGAQIVHCPHHQAKGCNHKQIDSYKHTFHRTHDQHRLFTSLPFQYQTDDEHHDCKQDEEKTDEKHYDRI